MEQVLWLRPPCELSYPQPKRNSTDLVRLLKEAPLSPVPLASDTLSNVGKNPVKQVNMVIAAIGIHKSDAFVPRLS